MSKVPYSAFAMFFPSLAAQCLDDDVLKLHYHATVHPFCCAATFRQQPLAAILALSTLNCMYILDKK